MWGGRFAEGTSSRVESFSESVSIDSRLYAQDIRGSIAHARMNFRHTEYSKSPGFYVFTEMTEIIVLTVNMKSVYLCIRDYWCIT